MHFMKLTSRDGESILVNFDRIETIYKVTEGTQTFTNLTFDRSFLYVQETYELIADMLAQSLRNK